MKAIVLSLVLTVLLSPAATPQGVSNESLAKEVADLKRQIAALEQRLDLVISMLNRQTREGTPAGVAPSPNPPPPSRTYAAPATRPPVNSTRIQCQATTKKGTQCSRLAAAGASYCWQHGR